MPTKPDPCDELAQTIADWASALFAQPGFSTIDEVLAEMQKDLPQLTREEVVNALNQFAVEADSKPLQKQRDNALYKEEKKRREIEQKIEEAKPRTVWGHVSEPVNVARAMMTSMDFSAVLRQGMFIGAGNPLRSARALPDMFRAFASEQASFKAEKAIESRPSVGLYKRAGLYLASADGSISQHEEAFMSRLAGKIPLVKGSQRAYNLFLNRLRADTFDALSIQLAKHGDPTLVESKAIANYINAATGRGHLGMAEQAAQVLNTVFFSPRYVASRFQLLAGQPLYGGSARTRKLIAREYAKFIIGMGVVFALGKAAGAELEDDPSSSDFLKMKFGNTRLDPMAGMSQIVTLGSRLVEGKKKSDNILKPDRAALVGKFLRTKLAPVPGAALDLATGKNVAGQEVTPGQVGLGLVTPLSMGEIGEAIEDQGVAKGTSLSLLNIFGMGLQVYKK
jgi:hypothetical protein